MAKQRPSFFERLTGAVQTDDYDFDEEEVTTTHKISANRQAAPQPKPDTRELEQEAQLNVDVINAAEEIVIKALVAGVKPADLDFAG